MTVLVYFVKKLMKKEKIAEVTTSSPFFLTSFYHYLIVKNLSKPSILIVELK